jgi:thiosulfate dehydrogenase
MMRRSTAVKPRRWLGARWLLAAAPLLLFGRTLLADELPTLDALPQRASMEVPVLTLPNQLIVVPVTQPGEFHVPPPVRAIPQDHYGGLVALGRKIFTDTQTHAQRYVGNGLNCSSCHLQEGRKPYAAPLWAAYPLYPLYRDKNRQVVSFEERIQDCFRYSMNGIAPTLNAPELKALVAYSHWLASTLPIGVAVTGRGFARIDKSQDPSPLRGQTVYRQHCALCHGADGLGRQRPDGRYQFPPLWGSDSYNEGAGMHGIKTCAAFVKANMPLGQANILNDDEALDVCAYIWMQDRPWDPRKSAFASFFSDHKGN